MPVSIHYRKCFLIFQNVPSSVKSEWTASGATSLWYSDPVFPKSFLELDCYFSIGPDVWWNPAVRNLAAALPADRILIETDGMGAVKWAYEEAPENLRTHPAKAASLSVPASLSFTLQQIAEIRQALPEAVGEQLRQNFLNCFRLSPNR